MVSFIEYQQVDLIHLNERMHEALKEDFCGAHEHHVFCEMLFPHRLRPQIGTHCTAEALNLLVEVTFENRELLEH